MPSTSSSQKYPLHAAIRDSRRTEESVIRMLREAYKKDPSSLAKLDDQGRTLIAVAAITANVSVITVLLELGRKQTAEGDDILGLQLADNMQETPASHNLRVLRDDPRFKIHGMLEMASKELSDGFIRNRLPPCMCGKCVEGWFSPRMRFRLRETARHTSELMGENIANFKDGNRLDGERILSDPALPFLPISILERGIHKPFYIGYRAAFQTVYDLLGRSSGADTLPTVQRLRVEFANGALDGRYDLEAVQFFAERGGSVRYALDYILHQALWESPTPLGDGSFDAKWNEGIFAPFANPISPVPSDLKETPRRRSRSNSFKGALKTFGVRRNSMDTSRSIEPKVESSAADKAQLRRWKLKEEWDASGNPGCPLDMQFGGVRYLLGLYEEPRWEFALVDVDPREKRSSCELRRV